MKNALHTIYFAALILSLSGCGSIVTKPVSDAERDTSGQYDGNYTMNIKAFKGRQQVGRAYFNCEFKKNSGGFAVKDGVATMNFGGKKHVANVGESGKFRFEIPSDRSYSNSRTGEKSAAAQITYVYLGSLSDDSLKGQFIIGKRSENNNGCSTATSFEKR